MVSARDKLPSPVDSMREAVLTVSPNKQYRGILVPTIPATTGPVWMPLRISSVCADLMLSKQFFGT